MYLFISHAWKTLLNYVFEDLRRMKAPNTQEDTGKLTLEAWNELQKKPVQPLSQKDQP
jgi:hypothetical protein